MFFVLTFVAAVISVLAPLFLLRLMVRRWHVHPKIFWKAGIAGMTVSLVVLGVTLNIDGAFPGFAQLPDFAQALFLGLSTGLFVELGKFLMLDRWMKKVRSRESAILFGLGWAGVGVLFTGLVMALGVFGMQSLLETKDLASSLPNADADQIALLQESQKQIHLLVAGSPLKALSPLLENGATIILDIAMTLLIVFGLCRNQNRYVWMAVGLRTIFVTVLFYSAQTKVFPVEFVFAGWIIAGTGFIAMLHKMVPSAPEKPSS